MCDTYDSIFRRAKEAIRRGDKPSDDWMALTERWLSASEAGAAFALGDRVYAVRKTDPYAQALATGTIVAINGKDAWVRSVGGLNGIYPFSDLKRA